MFFKPTQIEENNCLNDSKYSSSCNSDTPFQNKASKKLVQHTNTKALIESVVTNIMLPKKLNVESETLNNTYKNLCQERNVTQNTAASEEKNKIDFKNSINKISSSRLNNNKDVDELSIKTGCKNHSGENSAVNDNQHCDYYSSTSTKSNAEHKTIREKTPMCLVNDLARFNKISFQYRLTNENGPAHCKRFTVTLKLGDEEYSAEGFQIKKAQHLAAEEAIEKTKYSHPIPKAARRNDEKTSKTNITPTVELNALAMKLGQQTFYIFDPRQMPSGEGAKTVQTETILNQKYSSHLVSNGFLLNNSQRNVPFIQKRKKNNININGYPLIQSAINNKISPHPQLLSPTANMNQPVQCKITLIVGSQTFFGTGRTVQQAKHDAASRAIKVLKQQMNNLKSHELDNKSFSEADVKSPISQIFEIGLRKNLPVDFKVLREEGPAHMRLFTTACIVGNVVTEADGTGKKLSKKKAAEKMLVELQRLPEDNHSPVKLGKQKKKLSKINTSETIILRPSIAKDNKIEHGLKNFNPITKLLEWHQYNKEKEPSFKFLTELDNENPRRQQFVVEVSSKNATAQGVGSSKKLAKRNAAQNLLLEMGIQFQDYSICSTVESENKCEVESQISNAKARNKLIAKDHSRKKTKGDMDVLKDSTCSETPVLCTKPDDQELDELLLKNKHKVTVKSCNDVCYHNTSSSTQNNCKPSKVSGLHMKDQLLYLAKLLGFNVEFSDYPKGSHTEFLSIVMLSTSPPQICHGVGMNSEESQEDASKNALKILSEMGLNN